MLTKEGFIEMDNLPKAVMATATCLLLVSRNLTLSGPVDCDFDFLVCYANARLYIV
jgi:hypothetical protein